MRLLGLVTSIVVAFLPLVNAYTPAELAEATSWFQQIPWPDLKGKPYVEITGADSRVVTRGFLLAEDQQSWNVFPNRPTNAIDVLLGVGSFTYNPHRVEKQQHVLLIKPLHGVVQEVLSEKRNDISDQITERFVLARYCEMSGASDLAIRLDQALPPIERTGSLKDYLQESIGNQFLWDAYNAVRDPQVPRPQILEKFQKVARHFPDSQAGKIAQRYLKPLEQMILEDRTHQQRQIASLSTRAKIQEYIFQLRDQTGGQLLNSKIPPDYLGEQEDTPAHKLAELGLEAVPALMEALYDERLTRAVGNPRLISSSQVLTNADYAEIILSEIAGRDFYRPGDSVFRTPRASLDRGAEIAEVRGRVDAWWNELRSRGETPLMIEGIRKDDSNSVAQAELLMARDIKLALSLVEERLGVTESPRDAERFMQVIGDNETPASTNLLQKLLTGHRFLNIRVAAAEALIRRKDPAALPAMIKEWLAWQPVDDDSPLSDADNPNRLLTLLAMSGSPEAIRALAKRLPELPTDLRADIVESLFVPDKNQEALRLHEDLLAKSLDDLEVNKAFGSRAEIEYCNPRVCDMAAMMLHEHWPERYPLRWRHTRIERDEEIAKLRNIWRRRNQLPELPIPSREESAEPNIISEVRWKQKGKEFPLIEGELLTSENIASALARLQSSPERWKQLSISIERPSDRKGIVVSVEAARDGSATGEWDNEVTALVGSNQTDPEEVREAIDSVLALADEIPFAVYIECKREAESETVEDAVDDPIDQKGNSQGNQAREEDNGETPAEQTPGNQIEGQ